MPEIVRQAIAEVLLITPRRYEDARGYVMETYSAKRLAEVGHAEPFVQDNQSLTLAAGAVRGLHFQAPPHAQAKLVRVISGAIWDVAVDLRAGSPTYGRHVANLLSADNGRQQLAPAGFAHGFQTLEPNTVVHYKLSAAYAPHAEGGLLWNDPQLGIDWPMAEAQLNARDVAWPRLRDLATPF